MSEYFVISSNVRFWTCLQFSPLYWVERCNNSGPWFGYVFNAGQGLNALLFVCLFCVCVCVCVWFVWGLLRHLRGIGLLDSSWIKMSCILRKQSRATTKDNLELSTNCWKGMVHLCSLRICKEVTFNSRCLHQVAITNSVHFLHNPASVHMYFLWTDHSEPDFWNKVCVSNHGYSFLGTNVFKCLFLGSKPFLVCSVVNWKHAKSYLMYLTNISTLLCMGIVSF